MGRITIFSIEDCKFCRRAKAAFSARDIPYANIDVEYHPSKRADMISLTDRLTVPQIFLNEEHVGGADETLAMLARWDDEIAAGAGDDRVVDASPRDRYVRLVESAPDPTDERLAVPEGNGAALPVMDLDAPRTTEAFRIREKSYTSLEVTKLLIQRMPRDSLAYHGFAYHNAFKGSDGVTALQKIFGLQSREDAIELGMGLQRKHCIDHVCGDHVFGDNKYYFRLQPFNAPNVLNSFRVWSEAVDDEPMFVIHRLGKLWSKLESRHLNDDGMVDHATLRGDDIYWKFEEEACELQRISLAKMDGDTLKAFVINVYNLMIKYAFVKAGIPATSAARASFFDDVSINMDGSLFSFNDLEHGILRANTRHPYQLTKRFGDRDPRGRLALGELDPRVHFALNCGAKSCPPVKRYTAGAIEEELRLSAAAFCEQEENVAVDEEGRRVHLTKILYWYMADFATSKDKLPQKIAHYLRGEKKEKLDSLLREGNVTVKFNEYDWSSNDINFHTFEKVDLSRRSVLMFHKAPSHRYGMVQDDA